MSASQPLPSDLRGAFPPDVCEGLAAALRELYDAVPRGADFEGWNANCAGTSLYQMAHVSLSAEMERRGVDFRVERENGAFLFVCNGLPFTCQRVGSDSSADIQSSFPRNYRMGLSCYSDYRAGQALLGFAHDPSALRMPLVLAHIGNDDDGLLGVYLCRPSVIQGGVIRGWEFAYELYRNPRETEELLAAERDGSVVIPLPEVVADPQVTPKKRDVERRK